MKVDEKASIPRVRIAVLGSANVGKSALTVRYLTRRYIGEYRSNTDLLYKQIIALDNGLAEVEIVDISAGNCFNFPTEQIQWADACIIVYSITDRKSFEYASRSLQELKSVQNPPTAYLVGNKNDLDHLREVDEKEACNLAASHAIGYCEVSVAENTLTLYKAFEKLLIDFKARSVKQRKFSVSKMLCTLMGNNGTKQILINQGTVVPCHKSELHKSRVLKRLQGLTATVSL